MLDGMTTPGSDLRHGEVFDAVAEAYDAVRPGYPENLVDLACTLGGLEPGSRVLEIGCGTGKLTEALVERGLRVDAVDPGPNMIALARKRTGDSEVVTFHLGRFEDVALPEEAFDAVFSATAFHWVDPSVGWAKAARRTPPRRDPGAAHAHRLPRGRDLRGLRRVAHGAEEALPRRRHLATAPRPRDPPGGAEERSDNVSAVWTWLGHKDLTRPEAAPLFDDARLATHPVFSEQTADELWARLATSSSYQRLDPEARAALEHDIRATVADLGGTVRESALAVLVTAPRSAAASRATPGLTARSTARSDVILSRHTAAAWMMSSSNHQGSSAGATT